VVYQAELTVAVVYDDVVAMHPLQAHALQVFKRLRAKEFILFRCNRGQGYADRIVSYIVCCRNYFPITWGQDWFAPAKKSSNLEPSPL